MVHNSPLAKQPKAGPGPPTKDPEGRKREGRISARVLPETAEIFALAAGGKENVPTFLDELARIVARIKGL